MHQHRTFTETQRNTHRSVPTVMHDDLTIWKLSIAELPLEIESDSDVAH